MKDTIRNTVSEVYSNSITSLNNNKGILNKNTLNNNLNNVMNKNTTSSIKSSLNNNPQSNLTKSLTAKNISSPSSSSSSIWLLILFILIIILGGLIWLYKDKIYSFFEKKIKTIQKVEKKVKKDKDGNETDIIKKKTKEKTVVKKGNVDKEEKPKNQKDISQHYSPSKIVGEDGGFCYVGSDNNTRYCVQAYKGDVCTSGDIYNRIDKCIVPSLRT